MLNSHHQEYLDSLPLDWETMPIENIGATYSGGTPSRDNPEFWNGNIDWVAPGELTKLSSKWLTQTRERITQAGLSGSGAVLLPKDALLVTTRATIGAVAIAGMPVATNQGFKSIVLDSSNDPLFYFYVIRQIASEFSRLASGSTFDEISRRDFVRVVVPQPPLPEQRRIAAILDLADKAIEKTEALISKLKQTKCGLMHDLLTCGIDERSNLRDYEANPEQFKDSPLGRIPREWDALPMFEVVPRAEYGVSVSLNDEFGIPVLRMNNFKDGEAELSEVKSSARAEARGLLLEPLDVLFNRTNSIDHVGRTGIWRGQLPKASFASYLVRLVPDRSHLNAEYLNLWLNFPETRLRILRAATPGVHQVNINPTNLRKELISLPPLEEQHRIAEVLDAHDERIRAEEAYVEKLRLQKRGLMEDLLTGRVRVGDAEGKEAPA